MPFDAGGAVVILWQLQDVILIIIMSLLKKQGYIVLAVE